MRGEELKEGRQREQKATEECASGDAGVKKTRRNTTQRACEYVCVHAVTHEHRLLRRTPEPLKRLQSHESAGLAWKAKEKEKEDEKEGLRAEVRYI